MVPDGADLARLAAALVSLPDPASPKPASVTKIVNGNTVTLDPPVPAPAAQVVSVPDTTPPTAPVAMGIVLAGATVYAPAAKLSYSVACIVGSSMMSFIS